MTMVLTPLTRPPMNPPPLLSSPLPHAWTRPTARSVSPFQSTSRLSAQDSSSGRYDSSSASWAWSRRKAAGICWPRDMTASPTPGPMTAEARVSTPITAARVSTRARGRRILFILLFPENSPRSMARMGTLRIKAMAPPSRKGHSTPSSHPRAAKTAARFCRAQ